MTVPYTFATQTGNIPLAELDANFTALANGVNIANTVSGNSQPNITAVGTLTYLSSSGNVTASYFIGNGSQLTGITGTYSNSNVATYLTTYTGNITAGNVSATGSIQALGNVSGNYILGNGSQLTGITGNYSNTNVASYLTTYTGNIGANTVTANFFVGDGAGLTNLPVGNYSNANVEAYLPTSNTIIAINSNVSNTNSNVANLVSDLSNTNSNVANLVTITTNTDSNVANLTSDLANTDSNVANLTNVLANTNSNVANTNSNVANLTTSLTNTNSNVANLVTITTNTDSNVANLVLDLSNTNSNVANLVSDLSNTNSNVANLVTITTNTDSNVANLVSNVTTLQGQVYSNTNVASYLTTYTGNIAAGNISVTGNIYGNVSGNITLTPTYGAFYDTTTQTNSNVGNGIPMSYNTTDISNGISIGGAGNTEITISKAGIYNIQFSAQINKTGGGADNIYIWLDKNGNSVANSATAIYLVGNNAKSVAAWNFVVDAASGDYYRLIWEAGTSDIEILAQAAAGDVPAVPSVILTVVPVGA